MALPVHDLIELLLADGPNATPQAITALASMLRDDARVRVAVANAGGIPPLVEACRRGSQAVQEAAASALDRMAHSNSKNIAEIGQAGGIPPLVMLLHSGSDRGKEKAAGALERLTHHSQSNVAALIAADGIRPLLDLLSNMNSRPAAQEMAAEALARVSAVDIGSVAIEEQALASTHTTPHVLPSYPLLPACCPASRTLAPSRP